jgi:hypothetical protein
MGYKRSATRKTSGESWKALSGEQIVKHQPGVPAPGPLSRPATAYAALTMLFDDVATRMAPTARLIPPRCLMPAGAVIFRRAPPDQAVTPHDDGSAIRRWSASGCGRIGTMREDSPGRPVGATRVRTTNLPGPWTKPRPAPQCDP